MRLTLPGASVDVPERNTGVFRDNERCGMHGAADPETGQEICGRCWMNGQAAFGTDSYVSVANLLTLRAVTRSLMHTARDPSAAIVKHLRILMAANRSELAA